MPKTLPIGWSTAVLQDKFDFTKKPRGLRIGDYPEIPFVPMELVPQGSLYFSRFNLKSPDEISSGTYFEPNDLLLSKITPSFENGKQGIIHKLPTPFGIATTEVIPIKGREDESHILFLAFYLVKDDVRKWMAGKMEGSTGRQRLPSNLVKNLELPFPPFLEQRSIAAVLAKIQEAISAQQEIIERTRELKKALMAKIFTEGLRGEHTKETEIGSVPRSWEIKSISDCCFLIVDCPHSTPKFIEDGVRVVRNVNLKDGFILDRPEYFVTEEDYLVRTRRATLNEDDVIFSREAPVGEAGLVPPATRFCLGQRMMQFRTNKDLLNPRFLVYSIYTESIRKRMFSIASGVTAQHINVADMKSFKIPVPTISEQNQIVESIYAVDSSIFAKLEKVDILQDLFKAVLHELMTGSIRTTPLMEA